MKRISRTLFILSLLSFPLTSYSQTPTSFSISGQITTEGAGLSGGSIRIGRSLTALKPDGTFTATGFKKMRYSVRPVYPGMSFTPRSVYVRVNDHDITGVNFTGVCKKKFEKPLNGRCSLPKFKLTGTVLLEGTPLYNARIRVGKSYATTDSSGVYTFQNLSAGVYRPSATLTPYHLTPASSTLTITGDSTLNFVATCRSGYRVRDGKCVRNTGAAN